MSRRHVGWIDLGQGGFSSTAGLVAMAVSLLLVALLLVFSLNVFGSGTGSGSGTGGGGGSAAPSILSHSSAETQIKLCSEGRDSTYGSPPSAAQQAACIRELLTGISGVGSGQ
jgi:hypothetical protein